MSENCCGPEAETCAPNLNPQPATTQAGHCPVCGEKGKKVDSLTVKAMLSVSLAEVRDTPYRFCRTPDCEVVYFAADGGQTFTRAQVREAVYQKEPHNPEVFVCYCFRHTPASIRAEWLRTGQSTVVEQINAGIAAGQCACDIRNPQGSCCLGNVSQVVKQVTQEAKVIA